MRIPRTSPIRGGPGALDAIPGDVPVLLIGTGLTAVDVALTLTVRRGPRRSSR